MTEGGDGERSAGMMEGGRGVGHGAGDRGVLRLVRGLVASHPPPNLPPERGEG